MLWLSALFKVRVLHIEAEGNTKLTETGQCDAQLVFYLIEELFDSQTTDGCRIVLDYLESRGERLLQVG